MTPTKIQQWAREAGMNFHVLQDSYCEAVGLPIGTMCKISDVGIESIATFATLARADLEAELQTAQSTIDNCREQGALVATERDAWEQAHDEQVELLNKIASERDELRTDLEAENEKLRNHIKHIGNDALRSENASLKAEVESLREQVRKEQIYVQELAADAARYRWLKENCSYSYAMQPDSPAEHGIEYQWQQGTYEERNQGIDGSIDAAIDAALGETE